MDSKLIDLHEIISFEGFGFSSKTFRDQEKLLLEPQLKELGYSRFFWEMGDYDSFGPLTRVVHMRNSDDEQVKGVYG